MQQTLMILRGREGDFVMPSVDLRRDFGQMEVSVYCAPFTIPLLGDFTEAQNGAVLSAAIITSL